MARVVLLVTVVLAGCEIGPAIYVERSGDGDGEITSQPEGLHCGEDCAMIVDDRVVTLLPQAKKGSRFAGWDGDACAGEERCTLQLLGDTRVTARFEAIYHALTIDAVEHGTLTVDRAECVAPCVVRDGHTIAIDAVPEDGYRFDRWTGACEPAGPTCILTIEGPVTVGATFVALPKLTVTKIGEGRVYSEQPGIDCGTQCAHAFPNPSDVRLRAEPAPGWAVESWSGCALFPMGFCAVQTFDEPREVTVRFVEGCDVVVMFDSDPTYVSSLLAAPNRTVCIASGVTITGKVTISAANVTLKSASGARIVNPNATALEVTAAGARLENIELRGGAQWPASVIAVGAGATLDVVAGSVHCDGTACYSIRVTSGALRMSGSAIATGVDRSGAGILADANATVELDHVTIAGTGNAVFLRQSSGTIRDSALLTTDEFTYVVHVEDSTLELRASTVRLKNAMAGNGTSVLRLDGNMFRRLEGTQISEPPFDSLGGATWHSSVPNTFCHEGTSTTDGVFEVPLIRGTISASSTFYSVSHNGPGDCL